MEHKATRVWLDDSISIPLYSCDAAGGGCGRSCGSFITTATAFFEQAVRAKSFFSIVSEAILSDKLVIFRGA